MMNIANSHNKILTFLTACFLITMLTPFLGMLVWSLVSFLLMVYCCISYSKTTFTKPFFYLTLFLFVAFVYGVMGKGYGLNNGFVLIFLAFYSGLVICLNFKNYTFRQINILLNISIILLLYKIIGTFFVLLIDPNAVRNWGYLVQLTNSQEIAQYQLYRYMGMFSYGEGEAMAIILPALVVLFLGTRKGVIRGAIIILIIGGLVTQYMATLTTTFLLSIVFCALVLIRHFASGGVRGGLVKGIALIAIIGLTFFFLLQNNENSFFLNKMAELEYSYNEGAAVGDVEKRSDLYMQSIEVCRHNPIFGMGIIPSQFNSNTSQTVSFHTALIDYWGLFGVFSLFLYLAWGGVVRCSYNLLTVKKKKLYKCAYYSLFLLLLLKGPVSIDVSFVFSTVFISIFMLYEYYRLIVPEISLNSKA